MTKSRSLAAVALVICVIAAACGGGGSSGGGGGALGATSTTDKKTDNCTGKTLQATEIGISPTTIDITVMADIGSPLSPGLFQGSIDAVRAWAAYVNANGGLACRQVKVTTVDSKLSPDETKNGVISACSSSFVLLGTTALFLNDMRGAESCKDKAGATTGIPDLPALQTEPAEQCSPISFSVVQQGTSCPYSGAGLRNYTQETAEVGWFERHVSPNLHGVFTLASDLPSTITAATPVFAALEKRGIKLDKEFGLSDLSTQSQYAPVMEAIKASKSNFFISAADSPGMVKIRKEAVLQGVTSVKVWACELACYVPGFVAQAGAAAEGQYAWLQFLPFEEKGANPMLDAFLQYDKAPDAFGVEAFASGLLLEQAVNDIVAKHGPNAVTRAAIIADLRTVHSFNAGGLIAPTDIADRKPGPCIVIVQVQHGQWVQVDPAKHGSYDCTEPGAMTTLSLDPVKAYKPS